MVNQEETSERSKWRVIFPTTHVCSWDIRWSPGVGAQEGAQVRLQDPGICALFLEAR